MNIFVRLKIYVLSEQLFPDLSVVYLPEMFHPGLELFTLLPHMPCRSARGAKMKVQKYICYV